MWVALEKGWDILYPARIYFRWERPGAFKAHHSCFAFCPPSRQNGATPDRDVVAAA
jgi:hypothetical protein